MTDAVNGRLRRCALLCAIPVLAGASLPATARAADESGLWVGSTYMHASRSTKWISFSDSARGDFWFRVDARGNLHGYAVVADEPAFDSGRLNNLIGFVKGAIGAQLGLIPLPGLGAISGVALNGLVGVNVGFTDPMPIRSGPITGRLSHGQLSIDWARNPKEGLHFTASMAYIDHEDPLTSGTIPPPAPWPGNAHVSGGAGGALAIATYRHTSSLKSGRTDATSVYWTAHRVGGGA